MNPGERKALYAGREVDRQGCDYLQKRSYPNKQTARVQAAKTAKWLGKPVEPYRCPACKRWHLTTHPL